MTAKKELEKLDSDIAALEEESNALSGRTYQLHQQREAVLRRYVVEEKLLDGSVWVPNINRQSLHLVLEMQQRISDDTRDLLFSGWHSSFDLEEGVSLDFNDNEVSLDLKPSVDVTAIIAKYGLVIQTDSLANKILALNSQASVLQHLLDQLSCPASGSEAPQQIRPA